MTRPGNESWSTDYEANALTTVPRVGIRTPSVKVPGCAPDFIHFKLGGLAMRLSCYLKPV